MLFGIFEKMRNDIAEKVNFKEPGLYVALLFPIMVAFILTFAGSRAFSYLQEFGYISEGFYLEPSPDLHVHHYTYGFFVLAASGYLALIFNGPKAKYLIALLHGFGLGLAMDEFGMWLKLKDDDVTRWSYDGFFIFLGLVIIILTLPYGVRLIKRTWPKRPKNTQIST